MRPALQVPSSHAAHMPLTMGTYFVTLKTLSSRSARSTLSPKEVPGLIAAQTTSKMLPTMTCKDRRQHPGTRAAARSARV